MDEPADIQRLKQRCNRSVLAGVVAMGLAMLVSGAGLAPALLTTVVAVMGFALLVYGVHVGWALVYNRESDGPPS